MSNFDEDMRIWLEQDENKKKLAKACGEGMFLNMSKSEQARFLEAAMAI